MAIQGQLADQAISSTSETSFRGWLKSAAKWIAVWIEAHADAWAAAAMYDQLRRLSDTELRRRGLSRDTIARHSFKSFD